MAQFLSAASQSSLFHLHAKLGFTSSSIQRPQPLNTTTRYHHHGLSLSVPFNRHWSIAARAVSPDSATSVITNGVDSKGIGSEPEIGGGGGGDKFGGSGGNGGGGGGGDSGKEGGGGESPDDSKRKMALSMSQKFTLGYAALVGVGGLMGYLKSGSQKSLLAGGVSAAVLYYVYRELPTNPVLASSIGIVMSAALTGMMGSRFLRTRKVFPAGVVSFVSLVMTGGYLHGIMRSAH